ncbi:hypothetical protein B0H63DRAFT_287638 [Podospora didyma]|uniref:Uncharacterized protein n=1 Tax=Podospora didyma TaxID=330526 RepID=A0AAE0N632_9PEZI|nr:hypothetical protein B0H63DRAFT_287638 [Podospora didyma]
MDHNWTSSLGREIFPFSFQFLRQTLPRILRCCSLYLSAHCRIFSASHELSKPRDTRHSLRVRSGPVRQAPSHTNLHSYKFSLLFPPFFFFLRSSSHIPAGGRQLFIRPTKPNQCPAMPLAASLSEETEESDVRVYIQPGMYKFLMLGAVPGCCLGRPPPASHGKEGGLFGVCLREG